ncbi:MAG: hypothetical protein KUA37_01960 [Desulfomicrobium sp.]|nr:hypothetical protein [Pseudomonadota bacterium]MBV1710756.1 hypothetical protein [Desulfomicrobium sp.]MBU4570364.1 hypothetical protein [Pseudomonadota bacterium]MBU4593285.1 hypothetical protein [Pseudomonadota bacterium]MBV1719838.1 hypothetical protein [Desulfomicrobium sp.]
MATLESLRDTLAKYEAERDRILTTGASFGVDGATREAARLETINSEIASIEARIAVLSGSTVMHRSALFGGRG